MEKCENSEKHEKRKKRSFLIKADREKRAEEKRRKAVGFCRNPESSFAFSAGSPDERVRRFRCLFFEKAKERLGFYAVIFSFPSVILLFPFTDTEERRLFGSGAGDSESYGRKTRRRLYHDASVITAGKHKPAGQDGQDKT